MTKTMQAMQIKQYGQVPVSATQVSLPAVGATDVLVAIRAAGVNPIDTKTRDGEVKPNAVDTRARICRRGGGDWSRRAAI